jgi:hypothetical protein
MNYYKLYPLEYKNSIPFLLALSLSPDKGLTQRQRHWYLNRRGARLFKWAERWEAGLGEHPGKSALKVLSGAGVVLVAWGSGTLPQASGGCLPWLMEGWGLISILFSRISRGLEDYEAVLSGLLLSFYPHVTGGVRCLEMADPSCSPTVPWSFTGTDTDGGRILLVWPHWESSLGLGYSNGS